MNLLSGLPTIEPNSWNEELNNQISSYNLTGKSERNVRDALGKLQSYFSTDLDKKSFEVNDVDKSYKISGEGGDQFGGSSDDVRTNFFTGKLMADKSDDAMSIAASIYGNALKKFRTSQPAQATTQTKNTVKLPGFSNILFDQYGNQKANVKTGFYDKYRTDSERQNVIYDTTLKAIQDYRTKAQQHPEYDYSDIKDNKLNALEEAAKSKNWDTYLSESFKLGWSPQEFLVSPQETETWNKDAADKKADASRIALTQAGLSNDIATAYSQKGYVIDPDFATHSNWGDQPWMVDLLKGTIALKDPNTGKHLVIKDNQLFNGASQEHNARWENTDGGFVLHIPKVATLANKKVVANAAAQNDYNDVAALNINPFTGKDWTKVAADLNRMLSGEITTGGWFGTNTAEPIAKQAAELKDVYMHPDKFKLTPQQKLQLKAILLKAQEGLAQGESTSVYLKHKDGGVLMFQQGGAADAYMKKHGLGQYQGQPGMPSTAAPKNISNLVRGASKMDQAIIATNVASLAPGVVGAVGAGATTLLEAYKGATDEDGWTWGDTGNLALNLGLTAASFVGLGGLRGVVKGSKLASETLKGVKLMDEAGKAIHLSKDVKNISKLANIAKDTNRAKELGQSFDIIGKFAKENGQLTRLSDIAKVAHEAGDAKTLHEVGKVASFAETIAKNNKLINLPKAEGILKFADKAGKTVAYGNAALQLPTAISAAGKVLSGKGSDLTLEDANALTSVAFGLKTAGISGKIALGKKYGTTPGVSSPEHIVSTVNGEEVKITDISVLDKFKSKNLFKSKQNEKVLRNAFLEKYNSQVAPENKIKMEDLGELSIKHNKATNSDPIIRTAIDPEKNIPAQRKAMQWAEKYNLGRKPFESKVKTSAAPKVEEVKPIIETEVPKTAEQVIQSVAKKVKPKGTKKQFKLSAEQVKKANSFENPELDNVVKKRKYKTKKDKSLDSASLKEGGTLKLQKGTGKLGLGFLDPKSLQIKAKNKNNLNYNPLSGSAGIFDDKGQYTPEFTERRKLITPDWFKANQGEIQKRITESGSNYKLNNIDQLLRGSSDFKPGILHDIVMNYDDQAGTTQPEQAPGAEVKAPDPITKGLDTVKSNGLIQNPITGKGVFPQIGKALNWLGKNVDATDVSNLAMYANTVNTNRSIGNEQRQAVTDSMYTLPYMPNTYIRMDKPYTLMGDKQAANLESKTARMAASTSDIDKGFGARLAGSTQGNAIRDKAQMADQQRLDQLRGQQTQMNSNVAKVNTDILGKNRGLASTAFKQIHLINANQSLAQNTALNNLVLAANRNLPVKEYKRNLGELYKFATDPNAKSVNEMYSKVSDDSNSQFGLAKYLNDYNKYKADAGSNQVVPFEQSQQYIDWNNAKKNAELNVNKANQPYQNAMMRMQYQLPLLYSGAQTQFNKAGGSLTKQDKMDIDDNKAENKRISKDEEMTFKAILHNNEILQKALIRVFK